MNSRKYLSRSLKYLARMIIIIVILFFVMYLGGWLAVESGSVLKGILLSGRGAILIVALVLLAAAYPKLSFATVEVEAGIKSDRETIVRLMNDMGFVLASEENAKMVFRASSITRRLMLQFDDAVTVWGDEKKVHIEGMKRDVFRVASRLNVYLAG